MKICEKFPVIKLWLLWLCLLEGSMSLPAPHTSNTSVLSARIVGGNKVEIRKHPHQVSLQNNGRHTCGASILSTKFVVTAAHCTYRVSASRISFRAGSTSRNQGGQMVKAKSIRAHPKFDYFTVDYDVAVVEVTPLFKWNDKVKPIQIGSSEPREGTLVTASGWGTLSESSNRLPTELRAVEVPVVNRRKCKVLYFGRAIITDRMICAGVINEGGKDSCQGDSGGPLVSSNKLVGIVSWGFGCGTYQFPGVYTNLNNKEIRNFIKNSAGI